MIRAWVLDQLAYAPSLAVLGALAFLVRQQSRYRAFQYVYFTRVPLIALSLVAIVPWILLFSQDQGVRTFVRFDNLFTLTKLQLYVVTLLAAFSVWPAMLAGRLILSSGGDWFGVALDRDPPLSDLPGAEGERVEPVRTGSHQIWGTLVRHQRSASLVFAFPLVGLCAWMSSGAGWQARWEAAAGPGAPVPDDFLGWFPTTVIVLAGFVSAWAINRWIARHLLGEWVPEIAQALAYTAGSFFFWIVGYLLLRPDLVPEELSPFAVTVLVTLTVIVGWCVWRLSHPQIRGTARRRTEHVSRIIGGVRTADRRVWNRRRHRWRVAFKWGILIAAPPIAWVTFRDDLSTGVFDAMPAIGYLLIILINLTWILTLLTYVLDRLRVSLVLTLVVLSLLANSVFGRDSVFATRAWVTEAPPSFAEAVATWTDSVGSDGAGAVVIAASGGGVMSSYWTARVLTTLQADAPDFARRVVLTSGTSGGAMGVTSFVSGYRGPRSFPNRVDGERVLDIAGTSALGHTTWGIAFPDLLGAVTGGALPIDARVDRGWSLEHAWRGADEHVGGATLGSWSRGVREGWRPAVVLNTTIGETGGKLAFSTVRFPEGAIGPLPGIRCPSGPAGFTEAYPLRDVELVTAARLSASFPWVLPQARAEDAARRCHLGDGGYNDNSALWSVLELLQGAGPEAFSDAGSVLIVEIRIGGPENVDPGDGARWSLGAPIQTLVSSVWTNASHRDALEVCLLRNHWSGAGVEVDHVVFQLNDPGPFFWGLTATDRRVVDEGVRSTREARLARDAVRRWMRGEVLGTLTDCG